MKHLILTSTLLLSAATAGAWSNSVSSPMPVFPTGTNNYGVEVKACPDGTAWGVMYYPNLKEADGDEYQTDKVIYEYRLQHFDKDGRPTFDPMGILISDYNNLSYTVINQYLLADADGNAVIAVADSRNSSDKARSYTAYKVSPSGEMLWGEDGVAISDPLKPCTLSAAMSMVELEDHSVVFAWHEYNGNDMTASLHMQRISKDGKPQWDPNTAGITDEVAGYPHLVNGGDNTLIMVYARTASNILYARKIDFEGESVWGKDVRIYRGGWGSAPLQTYINVAPSGNGGALVAWCDDRANTGIESAYLSYVTPEGKIGFAGASDEGDVKLSYAGWRNFSVSAAPANDGSGFFAVWRSTDVQQRFQGVQAQKVNLNGEIMWGDEALYIEPVEIDKCFSYISVQPAGKSDMVAFYEEYRSWFDQQCYAMKIDTDGIPLWESGKVAISAPERGAAQLQSQPMPGGSSWLCVWNDGGTSDTDKDPTTYMALVNDDSTLGNGNDDTGTGTLSLPKGVTLIDSTLRANLPDGATADLYTISGQHAARALFTDGKAPVTLPAGLYIATLQDGRKIKFSLK